MASSGPIVSQATISKKLRKQGSQWQLADMVSPALASGDKTVVARFVFSPCEPGAGEASSALCEFLNTFHSRHTSFRGTWLGEDVKKALGPALHAKVLRACVPLANRSGKAEGEEGRAKRRKDLILNAIKTSASCCRAIGYGSAKGMPEASRAGPAHDASSEVSTLSNRSETTQWAVNALHELKKECAAAPHAMPVKVTLMFRPGAARRPLRSRMRSLESSSSESSSSGLACRLRPVRLPSTNHSTGCPPFHGIRRAFATSRAEHSTPTCPTASLNPGTVQRTRARLASATSSRASTTRSTSCALGTRTASLPQETLRPAARKERERKNHEIKGRG